MVAPSYVYMCLLFMGARICRYVYACARVCTCVPGHAICVAGCTTETFNWENCLGACCNPAVLSSQLYCCVAAGVTVHRGRETQGWQAYHLSVSHMACRCGPECGPNILFCSIPVRSLVNRVCPVESFEAQSQSGACTLL